MLDALKRVAIVPFEMSIALLAIISGFTGLLHIGIIDPVDQLLPVWEAILFNLSFLLCGVFLALGIVRAKGGIESLGLWLLNGIVLSRFILYGYLLGFGKNFLVTGLFDAAILAASVIRLYAIRKNQVLVKVKDVRSLDNILSD